MTSVLDGRALAKRLNKALKQRVDAVDWTPGLAVVLVGSDPASQVYVRRKGIVAGRIGFAHRQIDLPADATQDQVLEVVRSLNEDEDVDGILVQFPLPRHIDAHAVLDTIDASKDCDGLSAVNLGRLVQGRPGLVACTPRGVMRLIAETGLDLSGKSAVVLGRSNIVGRPMALLLEQANATVTVCHSRTKDVRERVRQADVLVAAVGRPEMIGEDWIKPGAVIIDVGINRLDDGRLVGDVAYAEVTGVASAVTPVPGGVGPMTIAMLMQNTFDAAMSRRNASF
jgi:methylenetetrahydrofolate dehydrogenase (NADP+)/methenyltetrahydrofolate cyclohydrolase